MANSSPQFSYGPVFLVLGMLLAIAGLSGLKTSANYQVYFDPEDPLLLAQQRIQNEFRREDTIALIADGLQRTADGAELEAFGALELALRALPQIVDVRSFHQFLSPGPELAGSAGAWEIAPGGELYISENGRAGIVEIDVRLRDKASAKELNEVNQAIRAAVQSSLPAQLELQYSGPLALNLAYADVIKHDLRVFVPGLLVLTWLVLYLFLRHWLLCASLLLLGLLSAVTAYGISGWLSFELAAINAFGPIIIISLSLATQMHLVLGYLRHLAMNKPRRQAVVDGFKECQTPFILSCVTTAAGFLCLLASPSPPVQKLGITVALGIIVICLLGQIALPRLLIRLSLDGPLHRFSRWQLRLQELTKNLGRYRLWVILAALLLGLPSLYLLKGLEVDDSVYRYFPQSHPFSVGVKTLDQRFDGSVQMLFELDSGLPQGVFSQTFISGENLFYQWLNKQPEVRGIIDPQRLLADSGLSSLQPEQLAALLSANDTPLRRHINSDYSKLLVTAILHSASARELLAFNARAEDALLTIANIGENLAGNGPDLIFANLGQRNAISMFVSLASALAVITLVLGIFFRSIRLGFIALICNSLPVVIVYGLWVLAGGNISLGSAVVMGMILGIIVDDTIHMIYGFKREPTGTVAAAAGAVGPALVFSSLALSAGLAVGLLSDFRPIWELSLLSLCIILAAMLTDLLLLPTLLHKPTNKMSS